MKYDQLQGLYSPPTSMESAAMAVRTGNSTPEARTQGVDADQTDVDGGT